MYLVSHELFIFNSNELQYQALEFSAGLYLNSGTDYRQELEMNHWTSHAITQRVPQLSVSDKGEECTCLCVEIWRPGGLTAGRSHSAGAG